MIRHFPILVAMAVATIATGCSTTRYTARVVDSGYRQDEKSTIKNVYRISKYKTSGDGSTVLRTAYHVSTKEVADSTYRCLNEAADQKTVSIPVALEASKIVDRLSDDGSFLNAITFGLLPFTTIQETIVRIKVSSMDSRVAFRERTFDIKLEHKSRFTPFFGIWPYLPEDDDVICRTQFGGTAVNCFAVRDVYLQALGRGVANMLTHVDADVTMKGETFLANESAKRRTNAMKPKETVAEKAAKRNKKMKIANCPVCGSERAADGKCPLCDNE